MQPQVLKLSLRNNQGGTEHKFTNVTANDLATLARIQVFERYEQALTNTHGTFINLNLYREINHTVADPTRDSAPAPRPIPQNIHHSFPKEAALFQARQQSGSVLPEEKMVIEASGNVANTGASARALAEAKAAAGQTTPDILKNREAYKGLVVLDPEQQVEYDDQKEITQAVAAAGGDPTKINLPNVEVRTPGQNPDAPNLPNAPQFNVAPQAQQAPMTQTPPVVTDTNIQFQQSQPGGSVPVATQTVPEAPQELSADMQVPNSPTNPKAVPAQTMTPEQIEEATRVQKEQHDIHKQASITPVQVNYLTKKTKTGREMYYKVENGKKKLISTEEFNESPESLRITE